jgi:hypothetical protein
MKKCQNTIAAQSMGFRVLPRNRRKEGWGVYLDITTGERNRSQNIIVVVTAIVGQIFPRPPD